MPISRKMALERLGASIGTLQEWYGEIENPQVKVGDVLSDLYPDGAPQYINVRDLNGVDVEQLRSEVALVAAELDAWAASL